MIKEYPLDGVRSLEITINPDERGFFAEALRQDWKDFIPEWIVQANLSFRYPGIVTAWHKHVRGQVDYFLVLKGALKICAYDETSRKLVEIVGSEKKPTLIRIPGNYIHGTKVVSDEPALAVYFVTKLYEYKKPDEVRIPFDSPDIIPLEINGSKNDPRVGKPFDWLYPPHK